MLLPFGIFALAFPGAIVGYYLVSPTPAADVGTAMGMIIGGGLSSWGVLGFLAAIGKVRAADGLLLAALMAALVFYWFTPPSIVSAFSLRPGAVPLLRLAGVGLVALWALRAFRPETPVELTLRRPLS
jgi:hypothetical protein